MRISKKVLKELDHRAISYTFNKEIKTHVAKSVSKTKKITNRTLQHTVITSVELYDLDGNFIKNVEIKEVKKIVNILKLTKYDNILQQIEKMSNGENVIRHEVVNGLLRVYLESGEIRQQSYLVK